MESWKGSTSLSFCFNDGYFKPEDAASFLRDIAGFMLAVCGLKSPFHNVHNKERWNHDHMQARLVT